MIPGRPEEGPYTVTKLPNGETIFSRGGIHYNTHGNVLNVELQNFSQEIRPVPQPRSVILQPVRFPTPPRGMIGQPVRFSAPLRDTTGQTTRFSSPPPLIYLNQPQQPASFSGPAITKIYQNIQTSLVTSKPKTTTAQCQLSTNTVTVHTPQFKLPLQPNLISQQGKFQKATICEQISQNEAPKQHYKSRQAEQILISSPPHSEATKIQLSIPTNIQREPLQDLPGLTNVLAQQQCEQIQNPPKKKASITAIKKGENYEKVQNRPKKEASKKRRLKKRRLKWIRSKRIGKAEMLNL